MINKVFAFIYKNLDKIILITAILLSIGSFIYYYDQGLITAYGDSKGHLNIARRVVDSLTPGAAQLGGYWLPLLHILMLPTVGNDFLWNSGISGSIPNMISFVIAVYFVYKFGFELTKSKLSGLIAAVVVGFNLNLIYMQTTPMTESLFIATITVGIYYFYRWLKYEHIPDGLIAAFFVLLSSLNRYEGWALTIGCVFLLIYNWVINKFNKKQEGKIILFSSLACIGIFIWLLWSAVIFNDPFEFMHNTLSAGTQTRTQFSEISIITGYYNLPMAIATNIFALKHTSSYAAVIILVFGLIFYLVRNIKEIYKPEKLVVLLLLTPILFDILTVYIGNVPVEVPEFSKAIHSGFFNVRYSLYVLPLVALLAAYMFKNKYFKFAIIVIFLVGYFTISPLSQNKIAVLQDIGTNRTIDYYDGIRWFLDNYHNDGLILTSTGSEDTFMHDTKIHLDHFISEGSYRFWDESMEDPGKYATWVIITKNNSRDAVYEKIDKKKLFEQFDIKYQSGSRMILKIKKDED